MIYPPITWPDPPSDDDFDEAYDSARDAELGDGASPGAVAEPSAEEQR